MIELSEDATIVSGNAVMGKNVIEMSEDATVVR